MCTRHAMRGAFWVVVEAPSMPEGGLDELRGVFSAVIRAPAASVERNGSNVEADEVAKRDAVELSLWLHWYYTEMWAGLSRMWRIIRELNRVWLSS